MMEDEYTQVSIRYENQLKCSCIVKHSIIWQNLVQRHAEEWKTERKICLSIYELVNIWHTDNLYCNSGNQTHVLVSSKPEMVLKNYICLNSKIIKNQLIAYQYFCLFKFSLQMNKDMV